MRREVLEEIPFPIGYGVETAHLIDVFSRWGISAFAQTDLDQRVHRNQDTRSLGKMAFGILQTFFLRLRDRGWIESLPHMESMLRQFQVHNNEYEMVDIEIHELERPPMIEIPEYTEKFGTKKVETDA